MSIFGKLSAINLKLIFDEEGGLSELIIPYLQRVQKEYKGLDNFPLKIGDQLKEKLTDDVHSITLVLGTKKMENCVFEGHEKHIDIHYVLDGEEIIGVTEKKSLVPNMEYNSEGDYTLYKTPNDKFSQVVLKKGDFALFFPEDAHMTCIAVDEPSFVVKCVIKTPI